MKIVTRGPDFSKEDEEALRQEVAILMKLDHPNIVQAYDFFEDSKYFHVIMEYLGEFIAPFSRWRSLPCPEISLTVIEIDGGELFDRIVKKTFYNEKEARDLVLTLLLTLKFLHDRNIVHR